MIKGNTKKFLSNIYGEFSSYYENDKEGVRRNIESAGSVRNYIEGGCFYCYTSQVIDFLARIYENTEEEKAKFAKMDSFKIWERYVNVCCLYLPKWLNAKS